MRFRTNRPRSYRPVEDSPSESAAASEQEPRMRRLFRLGTGIIPYLAWLIPLMDRMFVAKRQAPAENVLPAIQDLKNDINHHIAALRAAQVDVTPAIEEQQRRLERLEEQSAELNHSITNLCEDQMDLAEQIRNMSGWVRNAAIAGLFLLTLMLILKTVQMFHGGGH